MSDMRLEPTGPHEDTPLWAYLLETATLRKRENIPPTLAGDWVRSILTGSPYPFTLLSTILMRIRADKDVNVRRVSILKSILVRNFKKEVPVAFDPDNTNKGYLLGRLFAFYEQVQHAAAGGALNASVKDKYYGSASAQPRKVFPILERGAANHLSKLGKQKPGWRITLDRQMGDLMNLMSPQDDPFPTSLTADQQALFALGYYHQRSEFFKPSQQNAQPSDKETV
jgi:CRISPR-associated protein Csd1